MSFEITQLTERLVAQAFEGSRQIPSTTSESGRCDRIVGVYSCRFKLAVQSLCDGQQRIGWKIPQPKRCRESISVPLDSV